ncbi:hypothetical protein HIM_06137 [Hirsutella minnesotensis 3608]|uniref:Uncharacterized protein n=1 Tax=Hirsutella minnesotensis 3608 TaxID=1043627 RepID=A0A0F7ZJM4_9HYPO|nr:hypothetical protein HIM_06137 [Hirsutella minnesotensis 3608]
MVRLIAIAALALAALPAALSAADDPQGSQPADTGNIEMPTPEEIQKTKDEVLQLFKDILDEAMRPEQEPGSDEKPEAISNPSGLPDQPQPSGLPNQPQPSGPPNQPQTNPEKKPDSDEKQEA